MSENLIFDSHAHYDDPAFESNKDALLSAMPTQGIARIVNIGADIQGSLDSIALAQKYSFIYAAIGIHPGSVKEAPSDYLNQLTALLTKPKVVAIGEIGLDYYYEDNAPRAVQKEFFEAQLALAIQHDLPVIVHDRDAHADTLTLLKKYKPKGIVHCFSGSVEMAKEIISLGMYIGLGGAVTFKNAKTPVAVAGSIPLAHMVIETDAPYMAPVPYRGKRCDSTMIPETAKRIASAQNECHSTNLTAEDILRITKENAAKLFSIPLED